jgi:fatty acid desaturase
MPVHTGTREERHVSAGAIAAAPRPVPGAPLYVPPAVAWPTLLILPAGGSAWLAVAYLATGGAWPAWAAVAVLSLLSYAIFTPMHEAVHGSVFRRRALNAVVGNLAAPFLGPTACFRAYAYLHHEHHRNTNDPERDPDYWSGVGGRWFLPLAWLTTDIYYYWFYARRAAGRPWQEKLEIYLVSGAFLALFALAWFAGYGAEAILYWFLPGRIATGALACGFNYLPHRPHRVKAADDPCRATANLAGPAPLTTLLLMYHDYHLVHHLFPGAPFYRYPRIWRERAAEIRACGGRVIPALGPLPPPCPAPGA